MFKWAQQALADVAGTQEPIYGPTAIKTVAEEAKETETPYTELTKEHLKWQKPDYTCVENQTFYFFTDEGRMAFAQVIYSNVAGIKVTCQFNLKLYSRDLSSPHVWCTSPLSNVDFSEDRYSFYADDCAVELSEDGNSFSVKSMNDENAIVNVKITKMAPGYQAGKTGKTLFGKDLSRPWGSMRHAFWPRCATEGTITTKEGTIDMKGWSLFIYALQGMKPHHAAARWNFAAFCSPKYTLVLMEFTTPPSYGSTTVNIGGIAKDGELIAAGCNHSVTHKGAKKDTDNDWPEPSAIEFKWSWPSPDGKPVEAVIDADFGSRIDRVDVMSEVPGFVKSIVSSAAGTKPYIYQFGKTLTANINIGGESISEEGQLYAEATFICDI